MNNRSGRGSIIFKMEDTWDSNVSPIMLEVGMGELRGMSELQPSCSGQDIIRNINHQNIPQHQGDLGRDMNPEMQDLDRDLERELTQNMQHNQEPLHHGYYPEQVSSILFFCE